MHGRILSAVLALVLTAGSSAAQANQFDVVINLTAAAAETLGQAGETIIVSAWYYAEPRPGAEARTNAVGLIDLGTEEQSLAGLGGSLVLGATPLDTAGYADIGGPVQVNINVFSGRQSSDDNLLSCDFFDGPVSRAAAKPVALRCALIEEALPTEVKS